MFFTAAVIDTLDGLITAQAQHEAHMRHIKSLPETERPKAEEKYQESLKQEREERRHQEIVDALKQRQSSGVMPFLFGFLIGKS